MLKCTDYKNFCLENGTVFDSDDFIGVPKPGLVYVPMDRILEFFKLCNYTDNQYIVVSAMSDYGVANQQKDSVSNDMLKWINFILDKVPNLQYEPLIVPPRCNINECKLSDNYSVKMYTYTKGTFDFVPKNVLHWFSTNVNVDLPNLTRIPFGAAEWSPESILTKSKINKLYVNFQANTVERFRLVKALQGVNWTTSKSNVSHDEFTNDISAHKWVLCPEGNGLDSFRPTEVLSAGSIPVMVKNEWNSCYFENFPVILLDKWEDLSYNTLLGFDCPEFSKEKLEKDFWINKIKEFL